MNSRRLMASESERQLAKCAPPSEQIQLGSRDAGCLVKKGREKYNLIWISLDILAGGRTPRRQVAAWWCAPQSNTVLYQKKTKLATRGMTGD
jgi:hypothetical protein